MDLCSKPSCARPGAAILSFDYGERLALLDDPPAGRPSPHVYVMCGRCAERLRPPIGWDLEDRRSEPPLFLEPRPALDSRSEEALAERLENGPRTQLFFGYRA
jgi:hypothetical protein